MLIGVFLLIVGVGFIIVSFIPIPEVKMVPKTVKESDYEYRIVKETWLNETFVVQPGEAKAYCGSFSSEVKLIISVNVLRGGNRDIDFYVMDEPEWRVFSAGGSFYYYPTPSRTRITYFTVEWHPPADKKLCFVFSNKFSIITSKTVEARIDYETKKLVPVIVTRTVHVPETSYYTLSHLAGVGIVLSMVGIGSLVAYYYVSKSVTKRTA